ncbi:hypothetical protein CNMCM8927_002230 [Aspergillus lentulus]|uniref:Fucose-specific lectin n=1 Tax=Aspergillus lentulus TaxID=293939 RepID=A0AAN5YIK3_ASPLE|nr:hypothetical protein CNMCM8927_002230 [Aspergillus lentulus]
MNLLIGTRIAAVNSTNRLRVYLQDVYGSIPESLSLTRDFQGTEQPDGTTGAWAVPSSKLPYSGIAAVFLAGTDALQLRSYVQKSDDTIQEYMWNGDGWEEGTNLGTASPVLVSEPPPSAILTTMAQASGSGSKRTTSDASKEPTTRTKAATQTAIFDKAPPRTAIAATSFGAGNSSIYMRIYFVNLDNTIWQVCWDHGKGYYDKPTITPAGQFRQ